MKYFHPRRYYRTFRNNLHDWFFYYLIPDAWEIRYHFKKSVGYPCNLKDPSSFNEKIQWIKLHDHNPIYPQLTDKLGVKEIVAKELGEEYVIPTLAGGFNSYDEIPFDTLPDQFVLKCNHDCKSVVVCKDKSSFDHAIARRVLQKGLARNYYHYKGKQWGYKDIKPQVFVEKFVCDSKGELPDYKFMMFGGECRMVFFYTNRFGSGGLKQNCYDADWNLMPFKWGGNENTDMPVPKPDNLDEMKSIATQLAALVNNSFVRVDLYNVDGRVLFGEYTFYPGGGMDRMCPREWDYLMGSWLKLPTI